METPETEAKATVDVVSDLLQRYERGERDFSKVRLFGADLRGARLSGARFVGSNFRRAQLQGADLSGAILFGADFTNAVLSGASLREAKLIEATFFETDLTETDMTGTVLCDATFTRANLTGTLLVAANLLRADLSQANLTRASLFGANLIRANFGESRLESTDFSYAWCRGTVFADVDLRPIVGIELIDHRGPSTVGIDTLFKSGGAIPHSFLQGCGVPDSFLAFARSLAAIAIEFYSCFISYSTADQAFAERIHGDLSAGDVRCWYAPHDVQGGKKLHFQIDEAIRTHDKLLLVLSPESMTSEWVKTEIRRARRQEKARGTQVLFPVRVCPFESLRDWELMDDDGKDLAADIREYFIPDFSRWTEENSYRAAFARLLRDLRPS